MYKRNIWKNGDPQTPLSADRMNHIELGIEQTSASVERLGNRVDAIEESGAAIDAAIATKVNQAIEGLDVLDQKDVADLINKATQKLNIPDQESVKAMVTKALGDLPVPEIDKAAITKAVNDALDVLPKPEIPVPQEVDALQYWFDPTKLYLAFVTYWWYDPENVDEKWRTLFANIDVVPWVIVNPRSGPGEEKEPNFEALTARVRDTGRPALGYVKTTESFSPIRTLRSKEIILQEIEKHINWYDVDGVFLDEMVNGWSEDQRELVQFYLDLYQEIKNFYGKKFLVVGNPGANTIESMIEAADVLMSFENTAEKYLNDQHAPVAPAHYLKQPQTRFCHVLHDVTSATQLRQVYDKFRVSNAAFFYPTTDTFTGVIGSESEANNPWDGLPQAWCLDMALAIVRRNLLPASVYTYHP